MSVVRLRARAWRERERPSSDARGLARISCIETAKAKVGDDVGDLMEVRDLRLPRRREVGRGIALQ